MCECMWKKCEQEKELVWIEEEAHTQAHTHTHHNDRIFVWSLNWFPCFCFCVFFLALSLVNLTLWRCILNGRKLVSFLFFLFFSFIHSYVLMSFFSKNCMFNQRKPVWPTKHSSVRYWEANNFYDRENFYDLFLLFLFCWVIGCARSWVCQCVCMFFFALHLITAMTKISNENIKNERMNGWTKEKKWREKINPIAIEWENTEAIFKKFSHFCHKHRAYFI